MQTGTNFSESFNSIYGDEISFLEKNLIDYPTSPLPVFLLLQKYKSTSDERFDQLIKKGALYFSNQNWLRFQLLQQASISENNIINTSSWKVEEEEEDTIAEAGVVTEANEASGNLMADIPPETFGQDQTAAELAPEPEIIEAEHIHPAPTLASEVELEAKKQVLDSPVATEKGQTPVETEEASMEPEKIRSNEKVVNETIPEEFQALKDSTAENFSGTEATESRTETAVAEEVELSTENSESKDQKQETNFGPEKMAESTIEILTGVEPAESPVQPIPAKALQPAAENTEGNTEITFEPLHTMDYFASQGIIIKEEALMNDKLGKQMKSFTDWLKSMKKLHPGKLPEQNEVVEKIIQSSAELSNEDAGVLTEAMAEVLIKQGKRDKAIEMYEKLSLMNPLKSIYFAAKIESLKN